MQARSGPRRGWFRFETGSQGNALAERAVSAEESALEKRVGLGGVGAQTKTQTEPAPKAQGASSRVGDLLLKQGLIGPADLRLALGRMRESGGALTTCVVKHCGVSEADLLTVLQEDGRRGRTETPRNGDAGGSRS